METLDFQMFTKAGNRACTSLYNKVAKKIRGTKRVTQDQLTEIVKAGLEKIAEKHGEVHDSEPPYVMEVRLNRVLESEGYAFELDSYDF